MKMPAKNSLLRNTSWMFAGQICAYGLRVVYFVMLARLLGVVQYGIVVGAFALVNIVAQYSRLGTGMVLLRYVSADRTVYSVYWGNILVTTIIVSCALILGLHFAAPHLIGPASAGITVLLAVGSCLCEQLTISATQVFQAFEDMPVTAGLNLLTSVARAVTAGVMMLTLHRATAMQWAAASMIAAALVAIFAVGLVIYRFGRPSFDMNLLLERSREGFEYAFASSTTTAYDDIDKAMLSHYGMNVAAGIYAMAYRIVDMATMPISSLQLAAEPRLFQLAAVSMQQTIALGKKLLTRGVAVSLGLAAVLFLIAPAIPYVAGKSFAEGVVALRWLCLIPLFRSVHYISGSTLTCSGHQRYRTINQIVAAGFNFGINLWLIPRFGWRGAAWASLATDFSLGIMNLAVLRFVHRRGHDRMMPDEALAGTPSV